MCGRQGGLFIIGTERHESRRIDNQLRGRSGRQGDPGETRFYLSMQDDIMRLFGSERIMNMMETLGIDEDTPIDAKILSGAIENAQKTVEGRNFQSRKNVLEYDDVMNVQRKIIYEQRRQVLDGEDLQKNIQSMMRFYVDTYVASAFGEQPKLADKQHFFEMMTHFEPIFFPHGHMASLRRGVGRAHAGAGGREDFVSHAARLCQAGRAVHISRHA